MHNPFGSYGDMSHDAVNRFLKREEFTGKDLFEENKDHIESIGCHISVDDTVIDKTFSEERYNDLVRQQYSEGHTKPSMG